MANVENCSSFWKGMSDVLKAFTLYALFEEEQRFGKKETNESFLFSISARFYWQRASRVLPLDVLWICFVEFSAFEK